MTKQICFKCGKSEDEVKLINHHTKYGKDEKIVMCCMSCHNKIHYRIRKEGECPLSVEETYKLSTLSCVKRTVKNKNLSSETLMLNVKLFEEVQYNINTGNINVCSYFSGNNGKKILYIGEK